MLDRQLRVGDGDRDAVAARLAEHFAEGRLSFAEFEGRVAQALSAITRSDLVALTADLPLAGRDMSAGPLSQSLSAVGQVPRRSAWRVTERLLAITGASILAAVLLAWGTAVEQSPPSSVVVCGP